MSQPLQNESTFTVKGNNLLVDEICPLCGTEFTPDVLWVFLNGKEPICGQCIEKCTSFGTVIAEQEPVTEGDDGLLF